MEHTMNIRISGARERRSRSLASAFTLAAAVVFTCHCAPEPGTPEATEAAAEGGGAATAGGEGGTGASVPGGGSSEGGEGGDGGRGSVPAHVTTLIHQVPAGFVMAEIDAAVAPDGTLYVVWGKTQDDAVSLHVSHSSDGGQSFATPVDIDTGAVDVMPWGESAVRLAASDTRVAVTFTDLAGGDIWVATSQASSALDFGPAVPVADAQPKNQFQDVAFSSDDELFVTWARGEGINEGAPTILRMFAARESEAFDPSPITDESNGRPCTCCGIDMLAMSTGEVLVTFRGMDSPRNQYVVSHPGTPGGNWTTVQASHTNWEFIGCPENGPNLSEVPGIGARLAWSDPTSGASRVWLVDSDDAGLSWHDERLATNAFEGAHFGSIMAIEPTSGRTWVGWSPTIKSPGTVVRSDDGGQTFESPLELTIPQGKLGTPRIVSGMSGSFAFGVVDNNALWTMSLQ